MSGFQSYLRKRNLVWVIGSGSLDRFPKKGCHDRLCELARKGGKDRRIPASSIFYKDCLFDIGPGVWDRIKKKEVNPKAIVLSHMHYDHISDLLHYKEISRKVPVYASALHKTLLDKLGIKAKYIEPDASFKPLPNLKVDSKVMVHTFTRPVSVLKFDSIIYAPDLGWLKPKDLKWAEGAHLWLGDGFNFEKGFEYQGELLHMPVKKLLLTLDKLDSLKVCMLLGIGHRSKYPHEDYEIILKNFEIENNLHFSAEIGFDNQVLKAP